MISSQRLVPFLFGLCLLGLLFYTILVESPQSQLGLERPTSASVDLVKSLVDGSGRQQFSANNTALGDGTGRHQHQVHSTTLPPELLERLAQIRQQTQQQQQQQQQKQLQQSKKIRSNDIKSSSTAIPPSGVMSAKADDKSMKADNKKVAHKVDDSKKHEVIFGDNSLLNIISGGQKNMDGEDTRASPGEATTAATTTTKAATNDARSKIRPRVPERKFDDSALDIDPEKLSVILYAKYRTGSTFASDFLNKHDDIFFTFEPLHPLNKTERAVNELYWLHQVLNCRFKELKDILLSKYSIVRAPSLKQLWNKRVFCHKYDETDSCGRLPVEELEEKCQAHKHVATKVILVPYLEHLLPFLRPRHKVIHLVRDPRGVFSSMIKIKVGQKGSEAQRMSKILAASTKYIKDIKTYCEEARTDLKTADDIAETYWGKTSQDDMPYLLVRYEDLATDPIGELQRLYGFLQIEPSKKLEEWVFLMVARSRGEIDFQAKRETAYGTYRNNSTATALAWRRSVPWTLVEQVQEICGDVMAKLGYVQLTQDGLLDDEVSVLEALPKKLRMLS